MERFTFESQGNGTYLIYKFKETDEIDSLCLGQITNNEIKGVASASFSQIDKDRYIKYNVSSRITARQFLSGIVNRKRFLSVLEGIVDGFLSAEEYAIDVSTIVVDQDFIFCDVSTFDTVLICLPLEDPDPAGNPSDKIYLFFKSLILNTQFDNSENLDYITELISFINARQAFSVQGLKALIEKIKDKNGRAMPSGGGAVRSNDQVSGRSVAQGMNDRVRNDSAQTNPVINTQAQESKAVPGPVQPEIPSGKKSSSKGKKKSPDSISWFYLMCHYSKQNKELYAGQKKQKKDEKKSKTPDDIDFDMDIPGLSKRSKPAVPESKKGKSDPVSGMQRPSVEIPSNKSAVNQTQSPINPQDGMNRQSGASAPLYTSNKSSATAVSLNFGETTVLDGGKTGETTVLDASMTMNTAPSPHLIRKKNNEKILLNKPIFRIGKERSFVDYFIGDNAAVSRSHANIINRNGSFFIVDTNSLNHTYVNGGVVQSNVEVPLSHGANIRLANEEFEFRIS